jgi:3-oxoacyl-[acyl-carrier-protein] synthase II
MFMNDCAVITGTALVCALGQDPEQVWQALLGAKTGVRILDGLSAKGFSPAVGAPVALFDQESSGIVPGLAGLMEKHLSMMLRCAKQALAQSHAEGTGVPPDEMGFFAGMGMVDYHIDDLLPALVKSRDDQGILSYDRFYAQGYQEIYPLWPLAMLNNVAFCQIAVALDLRGENGVFSPHADAGVQALAEGMAAVLEQRARLVLAGGVSETLSSMSLTRARLAGILNLGDNCHEAPCRPFAANRDGTELGEGCGMVVLERESDALARGISPLARFTGYGFACRGAEATSGPSGNELAKAMRTALAKARITPAEIGAVVAHGDGTVAGDLYEMEALQQVFAGRDVKLPVFAPKGALGHLFAGSPAVDLVLATQMLQHQMVPPSPFAIPLDPRACFVVGADQPIATPIRRVLINACSHEGPCGSLVVEAFP